MNSKFRLGIAGFGGEAPPKVALEEPKVDLEKIRNKKGQIGESSIEDIMLAMAEIKGDPELGKKLFVQHGCVACHSTEKRQHKNIPFMVQISHIMNRKKKDEKHLNPHNSITQQLATTN